MDALVAQLEALYPRASQAPARRRRLRAAFGGDLARAVREHVGDLPPWVMAEATDGAPDDERARLFIDRVAEIEALYPRPAQIAARQRALHADFGTTPPSFVPAERIPDWAYARDAPPLRAADQRERFVARVAELEALMPGDRAAADRRAVLHAEFGPPEWFFMREHPRDVPPWASAPGDPATVSDEWAADHLGPNFFQISPDYATTDAESARRHARYVFQEADDTPENRRRLGGAPGGTLFYVGRELVRADGDRAYGHRPTERPPARGDRLAVLDRFGDACELRVERSALEQRLIIGRIVRAATAAAPPPPPRARWATALDDERL